MREMFIYLDRKALSALRTDKLNMTIVEIHSNRILKLIKPLKSTVNQKTSGLQLFPYPQHFYNLSKESHCHEKPNKSTDHT